MFKGHRALGVLSFSCLSIFKTKSTFVCFIKAKSHFTKESHKEISLQESINIWAENSLKLHNANKKRNLATQSKKYGMNYHT